MIPIYMTIIMMLCGNHCVSQSVRVTFGMRNYTRSDGAVNELGIAQSLKKFISSTTLSIKLCCNHSGIPCSLVLVPA